MTIENEGDQTRGEFKAPVDAERSQSQVENRDREPTQEELAFYQNMSQQEWDARTAKWNQERTQAKSNWEEKMARERVGIIEQWMKKARAVEAFQATGDLTADSHAYFEAVGFDPDLIESPYGEAFRNGNEDLMVEYFEEFKKALGAGPSGHEGVQALKEAELRCIDQILRSHQKTPGSRKTE
jgi:hypothetical protein